MRELIASVASVQESAVTQLPQKMWPANPSTHPELVPPLPFGPSERSRYHADGVVEAATAAELDMEDQGNAHGTEAESQHEL